MARDIISELSLKRDRESKLSVDRFKTNFWRMLEASHLLELQTVKVLLNDTESTVWPEGVTIKPTVYWQGYQAFIEWYIKKHQRNSFDTRLESEPDGQVFNIEYWEMIGQSNRSELVNCQSALNHFELKGIWQDHIEPKDYQFWKGYREFIWNYINIHGKSYKNEYHGISRY